jgi:hypothetical protein
MNKEKWSQEEDHAVSKAVDALRAGEGEALAFPQPGQRKFDRN